MFTGLEVHGQIFLNWVLILAGLPFLSSVSAPLPFSWQSGPCVKGLNGDMVGNIQ